MIMINLKTMEHLRKLGAAKIEVDENNNKILVEFYPAYEVPNSKDLMNMSAMTSKSNVDEFERELDNISNMNTL